MSVINQVLNQLEERGATTVAEQAMVRPVPQARRSLAGPLLLASGVLGAGAWFYVRQPQVVPPKPPSAHVAASVAVPTAEPEQLLPASRLSFELSAVPLPSGVRQEKGSSAATSSLPPRTAKGAEAAGRPVSAELPLKRVSPGQRADAEFRRGISLMQQGRIDDAIGAYEAALQQDAGHHGARQALVALLLESKRNADAERVLQEGLRKGPEQTAFAMLLARLQVERGAVEPALATLEQSLPYAGNLADYRAFLAALLQRQGRHKEAVDHYRVALQLVPNNGVWLVGYGISLQGLQRNEDARDAFRRALDSRSLSPELQKFVKQKLG